jgi:hypothetical protein
MAHDRDEEFRRAIFVFDHGVADTRFVSKISCGVREKSRHGVFTLQRFEKRFVGLREERLLSALGYHFIGVASEHSEYFGTIGGRKVRAAGANGKFPFARSAAVSQIFDDFRAERFHRVPALNPSG